ncbi:hypothetical protein TARUN_9741 [Trichoderma arundinaceum]|uniref:Uncharacterized protein n=1 Tax=Trichoderma arundinaceum TaxID=490622 RepID=A0A395N8R2_TRIAR|nr:hypothetical protein TARUN_9741 [Trichoderma arundinaceum]
MGPKHRVQSPELVLIRWSLLGEEPNRYAAAGRYQYVPHCAAQDGAPRYLLLVPAAGTGYPVLVPSAALPRRPSTTDAGTGTWASAQWDAVSGRPTPPSAAAGRFSCLQPALLHTPRAGRASTLFHGHLLIPSPVFPFHPSLLTLPNPSPSPTLLLHSLPPPNLLLPAPGTAVLPHLQRPSFSSSLRLSQLPFVVPQPPRPLPVALPQSISQIRHLDEPRKPSAIRLHQPADATDS